MLSSFRRRISYLDPRRALFQSIQFYLLHSVPQSVVCPLDKWSEVQVKLNPFLYQSWKDLLLSKWNRQIVCQSIKMIKYYLDATIVISLLNVLTILRHAGWPQNMVPLDTVSTVYHSIYIHEQPRKVNDSKNIKSLHFDPGKWEPLKKHLFWSAIELEFNVYLALSTLWFLSRGQVLLCRWKLRFLDI